MSKSWVRIFSIINVNIGTQFKLYICKLLQGIYEFDIYFGRFWPK